MSPDNNLPEPSQAQKEAGNYKKGKVKLQGMDISIENPKDSVRSGVDEKGNQWKTKMTNHYGYVKGTVGYDKDHVDVFLGDKAEKADKVYVVDQVNPNNGKRYYDHSIQRKALTEVPSSSSGTINL